MFNLFNYLKNHFKNFFFKENDTKVKSFKKRFGKNPNVDTSFLPDKEREMEEDQLR